MSRMNFIATGRFSSGLETLCGGHSGTVRGSASFPAHRAPQRPGGGARRGGRTPWICPFFPKLGHVSTVKWGCRGEGALEAAEAGTVATMLPEEGRRAARAARSHHAHDW